MTIETNTQSSPQPTIDDDDDGFGFETTPAEPAEQVSSVVAIIRIVSVLGMGLCISFGLFISLVGVRGILFGIPCLLAAVPMFYGMQFAERLALRSRAAAEET